ncbi:N-acetyltransferase [Kiritimatiellota bacterium B12222]|nr:N-acetyltransferase [Kiritimatiellota bacterium B12222]
MKRIHNSNLKPDIAPVIRMMQMEDAVGLMRLRHRAIRECAANFGTPLHIELARDLPYYRRQLFRFGKRGWALLLGCWQGDALVGMTGIRVRKYKGESVGLIYSTYIEPCFRGQGLGKALVEEGRRQIEDRWGLTHCLMHVEVHNKRALHLYQECGFEITSKQERAFWIDGMAHDVFVLELTNAQGASNLRK